MAKVVLVVLSILGCIIIILNCTYGFCGGIRSNIAVNCGTMDGVYETLSHVAWERSVQF